MSIELFLIITFAVISVALAVWVTALSSALEGLRKESENMRRVIRMAAQKIREDLKNGG